MGGEETNSHARGVFEATKLFTCNVGHGSWICRLCSLDDFVGSSGRTREWWLLAAQLTGRAFFLEGSQHHTCTLIIRVYGFVSIIWFCINPSLRPYFWRGTSGWAFWRAMAFPFIFFWTAKLPISWGEVRLGGERIVYEIRVAGPRCVLPRSFQIFQVVFDGQNWQLLEDPIDLEDLDSVKSCWPCIA